MGRGGEAVEGGLAVVVADHQEVVGGVGQVGQRFADVRILQLVGVHGQHALVGQGKPMRGFLGGDDRAVHGGLEYRDDGGDVGMQRRRLHDGQGVCVRAARWAPTATSTSRPPMPWS